jgi:hypothetical protein
LTQFIGSPKSRKKVAMLEYTQRALLAKESLPGSVIAETDQLIARIEKGDFDANPQVLAQTGTGPIYYISQLVQDQILTVFYRKKSAISQAGIIVVDLLYGKKQ